MINAADLMSSINSVIVDDIPCGDKPNLIRFYDKLTTSMNKAVVEVKITSIGLEVVNASKNIKDIMGYTPEEIKGTDILSYRVTPIDEGKLNAMIRVLNRGEVVIKNNGILHKNGHIVYSRGILFKDNDKYVEFVWNVNSEFNL